MYNIIHLASSRGMHDSLAPRRPTATDAAPPSAQAARLRMMAGGRLDRAPVGRARTRGDGSPLPPSPSPSTG